MEKKLEDIGFYTLSDERARNVSQFSPLHRCELILTSNCNFNCPYCRGMQDGDKGKMSQEEAFHTVNLWTAHNLKNIRFSGGEPTLWNGLKSLVSYAKDKGVERIALSTNGSADLITYVDLIHAGVNDFSISLDSCCASTGEVMAGTTGVYEKIIHNIKVLSAYTYVTVGVVLTDENYHEINDIIVFASHLGVSDIRIIPAAQISQKLKDVVVDESLLAKLPILKYRYNNFKNGGRVRGLTDIDTSSCPLVLDDMAVLNDNHYPCIIYMREHGDAIGKVKDMGEVRKERCDWYNTHNCYTDTICKNNCLDVCIDYNNKVEDFLVDSRIK